MHTAEISGMMVTSVLGILFLDRTFNVISPRDRSEIAGWLRGEWAVEIHGLFGKLRCSLALCVFLELPKQPRQMKYTEPDGSEDPYDHERC